MWPWIGLSGYRNGWKDIVVLRAFNMLHPKGFHIKADSRLFGLTAIFSFHIRYSQSLMPTMSHFQSSSGCLYVMWSCFEYQMMEHFVAVKFGQIEKQGRMCMFICVQPLWWCCLMKWGFHRAASSHHRLFCSATPRLSHTHKPWCRHRVKLCICSVWMCEYLLARCPLGDSKQKMIKKDFVLVW